MSKLRNIQTTCDNCQYAPALSDLCVDRIKELMLEIVKEVDIQRWGKVTSGNQFSALMKAKIQKL